MAGIIPLRIVFIYYTQAHIVIITIEITNFVRYPKCR